MDSYYDGLEPDCDHAMVCRFGEKTSSKFKEETLLITVRLLGIITWKLARNQSILQLYAMRKGTMARMGMGDFCPRIIYRRALESRLAQVPS